MGAASRPAWFCAFLCLSVYAKPHANSSKPHIVFVMADDFGWANFGVHAKGQPNAAEALTPRLDALVSDGVLLDRHYVFRFCSPSRCAFTSGRNPIHVNLFNDALGEYNLADPVSGFSGIPRNMTGIAEKLAGAGYSTVAAGKVGRKDRAAGAGYSTVAAGKVGRKV